MPVLIIKTFTSKFCCAQFRCLTSLQANGLQVVWCGELLDLSGSLNGFSAVLCWGCCWAVLFCWACGEFGPYGPQTRIKNSLVVCILCSPQIYQTITVHCVSAKDGALMTSILLYFWSVILSMAVWFILNAGEQSGWIYDLYNLPDSDGRLLIFWLQIFILFRPEDVWTSLQLVFECFSVFFFFLNMPLRS